MIRPLKRIRLEDVALDKSPHHLTAFHWAFIAARLIDLFVPGTRRRRSRIWLETDFVTLAASHNGNRIARGIPSGGFEALVPSFDNEALIYLVGNEVRALDEAPRSQRKRLLIACFAHVKVAEATAKRDQSQLQWLQAYVAVEGGGWWAEGL